MFCPFTHNTSVSLICEEDLGQVDWGDTSFFVVCTSLVDATGRKSDETLTPTLEAILQLVTHSLNCSHSVQKRGSNSCC